MDSDNIAMTIFLVGLFTVAIVGIIALAFVAIFNPIALGI